MSEHNITVEGGTSVRLPTAGKYCDRDIVVTATGGGAAEPIIEPLAITENGTYTVPDGVDGYSPVTVNVPTGGGSENLDKLIEGTITEVSSAATSINGHAFYGCDYLASVNFQNATSIGQFAFGDCSKLASVDFPNATSIGNYGFTSCDYLPSANFPNVTSIGDYGFNSCSNLTSVDFPKATSIGGYAFQGCSNLTSVDFPNVTKINTYVFNGCSNLASVDFPKATSIGSSAFAICTHLPSVDFPNVTKIESYAFRNCYRLESVDFPKATSIGSNAFSGGYSLKTVIFRSATMCTLANTNAFSLCYHILGTKNATYNPNGDKDGYIYVPRDLVDSYKIGSNWSMFVSQFRAIEDYPEITGG